MDGAVAAVLCWSAGSAVAESPAGDRGHRVEVPNELDWLVAADSTLVRVHQHGASARRMGGNASTVRGDADDDKEGSMRSRRLTDRS